MESLRNQTLALPATMNLGSGKDFRDDCLNLDVDDSWAPDAVCDLSRADPMRGIRLSTRRFGEITLFPDTFDAIIANDVLEHVPDLMAMMTTCLALLRVGGVFHISVPYDLSYGAWQDPTHVRAFNERSWLYYTDWFWYMGWSDFRFDLQSFDFVPSPVGLALKDLNVPRDEILRTARAVDSMSVALRKVALTPADRISWNHWRERREAAQARQRKPVDGAVARPKPVLAIAETSGSRAKKAFAGRFAPQRDRYAIWIVTPPDYTHHQALDEIALGLSQAFKELGGSAPVIRDPARADGRSLIVLGAHLAPNDPIFRTNCILFNLEQADAASPWMNGPYLDLLRACPVIDYSHRNQVGLVNMGIEHARVLPIGFSAGLMQILPAPEKDIDILFYGSLNARRQAILEALEKRGVKVVHLFDVYGRVRNEAIARAKIVLNLHFYETAIFEIARVSFLLANAVCVVTEGDENDPDLLPYVGGLAIAPFDAIVERCMTLLADPGARRALADNGLGAMMRRRQSDLLQALFDA